MDKFESLKKEGKRATLFVFKLKRPNQKIHKTRRTKNEFKPIFYKNVKLFHYSIHFEIPTSMY